MEEARVEAVASSNGIHGLNRQRRRMELIFAAFCEDAFGATLDHNNGNEPR